MSRVPCESLTRQKSSLFNLRYVFDMLLRILFVTDSLQERLSFEDAHGLADWRLMRMTDSEAKRVCKLRGLVHQSPNNDGFMLVQEQVSISF